MSSEAYQSLVNHVVEVAQELQIDPDIELDESNEKILVLFGRDEEMSCYEFIKTVRDQLSSAVLVDGESKDRFSIAVEKWFTTSAACWSVDIKFSDCWSLTERLSA